MSPILTVVLVLVAAAVAGALGFYLGGENRKRTAEAKIDPSREIVEKQIDKENRKKGAKSEICAFRQRLQKEKDGRQSDTNNRCRKQKFCTENQNRRGNFVWRVILKQILRL